MSYEWLCNLLKSAPAPQPPSQSQSQSQSQPQPQPQPDRDADNKSNDNVDPKSSSDEPAMSALDQLGFALLKLNWRIIEMNALMSGFDLENAMDLHRGAFPGYLQNHPRPPLERRMYGKPSLVSKDSKKVPATKPCRVRRTGEVKGGKKKNKLGGATLGVSAAGPKVYAEDVKQNLEGATIGSSAAEPKESIEDEKKKLEGSKLEVPPAGTGDGMETLVITKGLSVEVGGIEVYRQD